MDSRSSQLLRDLLLGRPHVLNAARGSAPPAPGYDEVLVAGDPEWRTEAERLHNGIPLSDGNWETLVKAAAGVKVSPPVPVFQAPQ